MQTSSTVPPTAAPDSRRWVRPAPGRTSLRADILGGAALFAGALLSMALWRITGIQQDFADAPVAVGLLAGVTLPLMVRRRWPSPALLVVSVFFIIGGEAVVAEAYVMSIALFIAIYTVNAWEPHRQRAAVVSTVVVAAMFIWLLTSFFRVAADPPVGESVDLGPGTLSPLAAYMLLQVLINILYFAGAVWFGNRAWQAARDRALVHQRAQQVLDERARVESQAITIERMRLARELHDAVAHHVSLIGVQAAAARTLLDENGSPAAEALEHVEESARHAISELHGLLGTLRDTSDTNIVSTADGASTSGEPIGSLGVHRLPDLVDDHRAAGLEVELLVIGDPVPLRPVTSLNVYRITQEALTNVRKHAGGQPRTDVRLRYGDGAIEVEITDDGSGRRRRTSRQDSGGLGLIGMRERAAADGGILEARPVRDGGFLVRASIPLSPVAIDHATTREPAS